MLHNSSTTPRCRAVVALLLSAVLATAMTACTGGSGAKVREDAAVQAYVYTYPLVSVEVTRRQSTNVPRADGRGAAPMNQFANLALMPDSSFTGVVRPNIDTLYSSMFFDVSREPLVISVPGMGNRYHLFPIMDMWTNVQASPGTRTLGVLPGYQFAITGPNWSGTLPAGVREYKMPTDGGWIIGRIQVNGPGDIPAVVAIQHNLAATPLSAYGKPFAPQENTDLQPQWPRDQEVAAYIRNLTPQQYWDLYYSSLSHDQPLAGDKHLLDVLDEAQWKPNTKLDLTRIPEADRKVWESAWLKALSKVEVDLGGQAVNGWNVPRTGMGFYGTDYDRRAIVAAGGLGANLPEDAIYPNTRIDSNGAVFNSDRDYVLHFDATEIPPVRAFWSLTMYNGQGFLIANPLGRYAVRGETLRRNPDGSLDVYVQRQSPGSQRESNWLPAPASGEFNMMLRLYWPDVKILDGSWKPPAVRITA